MLCAGGDPNIKDYNGESVREILESRYSSVIDPSESKTLAKIRSKLEKEDVTPYLSVWKDLNPMHEAVTRNDLVRLSCFQMIGGQVWKMMQQRVEALLMISFSFVYHCIRD
jgi:hypothetical protein